jgi:hypothetical protein
MNELSEERLGELIASLPPAPNGWVEAAVALPAARTALDHLVAQATEDRAQRQALMANLEDAVRAAGVDPTRPVLDGIRARLNALEP